MSVLFINAFLSCNYVFYHLLRRRGWLHIPSQYYYSNDSTSLFQCTEAPVSRFPKLYENNRIFGNFPPHKNITVDLRSWTTGNCFSATWIILLIIIKSKHVFMEQEEVSRIHSRKLANWEKKQPEINNKHIYVLHQCLLLLTIFHILICAARFHSQMLWLKCYFNENFFPTCFHGKTKYASPPSIHRKMSVLIFLGWCFIY